MFKDLGRTREDANTVGFSYSIVIPSTSGTVGTVCGGDGLNTVEVTGPLNFGFAVSGPVDEDAETYPVAVTIKSKNEEVEFAYYNYEHPYIGEDPLGMDCTNDPPSKWMNITITALVSGLNVGDSYVLYMY